MSKNRPGRRERQAAAKRAKAFTVTLAGNLASSVKPEPSALRVSGSGAVVPVSPIFLGAKSARFNDPVGAVFKARTLRPYLNRRCKRFAAH